jgi:hypothetical protein
MYTKDTTKTRLLVKHLPDGLYKETNDTQLERISVYYNEIGSNEYLRSSCSLS